VPHGSAGHPRGVAEDAGCGAGLPLVGIGVGSTGDHPLGLVHPVAARGDPGEAIVRAVNDCEDNDSVAALVDAVVGALHGERSLPERWRKGLLGRTRSRDDGHVHELIVDALGEFVMGEVRP